MVTLLRCASSTTATSGVAAYPVVSCIVSNGWVCSEQLCACSCLFSCCPMCRSKALGGKVMMPLSPQSQSQMISGTCM